MAVGEAVAVVYLDQLELKLFCEHPAGGDRHDIVLNTVDDDAAPWHPADG